MSKNIIIAVDSGKFSTKAIKKAPDGTPKKVTFRTKMDVTQESKSADNRSCVVEYHGQKYMIGEAAETVDFEKNKAKLLHKICTYAAVAQLLNDEEDASIVLTIGCPLSIFVNVDERENYRKYFMSDGAINLSVNGESKKFTISDVIVCPESSGIIFKNSADYKGKLVGVVDIGGLNTNCCVYNKMMPIKSTSFTTNLGANIMTNDLKQKLNSNFVDANLQDWQMESIIKDGFIKSHRNESSVFIKDFFTKHMADILLECERKGWDLKNIDLIFTGGGSKLFEQEILRAVPDAVVSNTAQFDNVEGFYIVGAASAK